MLDAVVIAAACGRPVARVAPAPPAAIVVRTGCGTYEIDSDGSVRAHALNPAPPWAPGAVSHPAPNVWVAHPNGRLAVFRDGRVLWRSHVRHGTDDVVVHGTTIAFTVWGPRTPESFWMTNIHGREFRVGRDEDPIGWTAGGLVTQHGQRIQVRGPDGALYRTLAIGQSPAYDLGDATVVFVRRDGALVRTDGKHLWPLKRGVGRSAWVTLLGNRMLQVTGRRSTLYLRSDGSRLGVGPLSPESVGGFPDGSVGYVVREGASASSLGGNVVFLLDAAGKTHRLYTRRIEWPSCGEYASVSYSGGRLLYVDDEGPIAVLDPSGRRPPLDLTPALRPLQRPLSRSLLYADWLSNWR